MKSIIKNASNPALEVISKQYCYSLTLSDEEDGNSYAASNAIKNAKRPSDKDISDPYFTATNLQNSIGGDRRVHFEELSPTRPRFYELIEATCLIRATKSCFSEPGRACSPRQMFAKALGSVVPWRSSFPADCSSDDCEDGSSDDCEESKDFERKFIIPDLPVSHGPTRSHLCCEG